MNPESEAFDLDHLQEAAMNSSGVLHPGRISTRWVLALLCLLCCRQLVAQRALTIAGIASWDAKFAYDWWRPITAIRTADTDGNAANDPDPEWTPLIVTPPFPEHTSGHATFSAAAATVLAAVSGGDRFRFTLRSDGLFGTERTYRRFSDAAAEAGISRIHGGIHFMSANFDGQKCGRQVGEWVVRNVLKKNGAR